MKCLRSFQIPGNIFVFKNTSVTDVSNSNVFSDNFFFRIVIKSSELNNRVGK